MEKQIGKRYEGYKLRKSLSNYLQRIVIMDWKEVYLRVDQKVYIYLRLYLTNSQLLAGIWELMGSHPIVPTSTPHAGNSENIWNHSCQSSARGATSRTHSPTPLSGFSLISFTALQDWGWGAGTSLISPHWYIYTQHFFLVDFTKFFHRRIYSAYNDKCMYRILYLDFL